MRLSLIYPICQHAKQGEQCRFFANHPFHRLFEDIAMKTNPQKGAQLYPVIGFMKRYWLTKTKLYMRQPAKKNFRRKYPKNQVIKKTELSKYLVSFMGRPDKGAGADLHSIIHQLSLVIVQSSMRKKALWGRFLKLRQNNYISFAR